MFRRAPRDAFERSPLAKLKVNHNMMLFGLLGALALIIATANAFQDTSPFFLFSTSELLASSPSLVIADHITNIISQQLESCTSDNYIIVSQPGVNVADYSRPGAAPHLRKNILGKDKTIRSSLAVNDVKGQIDVEWLSRTVQDKCGAGHLRVDASTGSFAIADEMRPRVINLDFPALPSDTGRFQKLIENDAFLASVLDVLSSNKYTVIYTTSPVAASQKSTVAEPEPYEMDSIFQAPVHMELKRDLSHHKRASDQNITLPDGPLFERYQFLSPGLFMGFLITFILLSILYVAINGVASLQVSYAAFDKEMGPAAQKKQAQ